MAYVILNLVSLYQTTVKGFADPTNVFFTKRAFSASLLIEGTVGMPNFSVLLLEAAYTLFSTTGPAVQVNLFFYRLPKFYMLTSASIALLRGSHSSPL